MTKVESAVDRLLALGYAKYALDTDLRAVRKELGENLSRGRIAAELPKQGLTKERRLYRVDPIELMGLRMSGALEQVGGVLRAEGVFLESIEDQAVDGHHSVVIDGRTFAVYDDAGDVQGWTLNVAKRRFLEIANDLLEAAGSRERCYALESAEGFGVILLTSEMYNVLRRPDLKIRAEWIPRLAVELP